MTTLVSKMDKLGLLKFVANAEEVGKELLNYINENSEDL